nr:unnamed protein product [Callosobruchus chinensis]
MKRKHSGIISIENKEDHTVKSGSNSQKETIAELFPKPSTSTRSEGSVIMVPTTSASQIEDPVGSSTPTTKNRHRSIFLKIFRIWIRGEPKKRKGPNRPLTNDELEALAYLSDVSEEDEGDPFSSDDSLVDQRL